MTIVTIDNPGGDEALNFNEQAPTETVASDAAVVDPRIKSYETENQVTIHDGSKRPRCSGKLIDFAHESFDEFDEEERQKLLLMALTAQGISTRPCMVIDLAAPRDIDLIVDGKKLELTEEQKAETQPKCTRVVVPVTDIVDIRNLKPKLGRSVIRCNPAYPTYRWFQAINLLLHYKNKTQGRVIPFPLETTVQDENGNERPEIIYHAMRVSKSEYMLYQKTLNDCVSVDGLFIGFQMAAKMAYEILAMRGVTEITEAIVSHFVTDIILMGTPTINGVLVLNSDKEHFSEELSKNHFIYI